MKEIIRLVECPFENPYGYVYVYTNKINGHMYIGKHRFSKPYIDLNYKGSGTRHWKSALEKYGWDNFTKEVLFWLEYNPKLSEKEHNAILNEKEIYFIKLFNTYVDKKHYNETIGGDGLSSEQMSGENNHMYGRKGELSPTYGLRGEKSAWWGRKHTDEYKKRMSELNKGKVFSEETRNKIGEANFGHKSSEKQKQRASKRCKSLIGEKNPMWKGGKPIKNKAHSEFMKGKHMSKGTEFTSETSKGANNSQARAIVKLTLDNVLVATYGYMGELLEVERPLLHVTEASVRACCKHRKESYKGYKWLYKEEYIKG